MSTLKRYDLTYDSFLTYVETTNRVKSTKTGKIYTASDKSTTDEWTQTESLEQALHYARKGWDAGIKQIEVEKDLIISGAIEAHHSISGSAVDVGAYLSGSPENMIQFVDLAEREREELVVYCQLTYAAWVEGDKAMRDTITLLKELQKLNAKYSLRLVGVFASKQNKVYEEVYILIKDTYQNIVINNLAFAYHPSFFRRIWFRFAETKPYLDGDGYGAPYDPEEYVQACLSKHKEQNPRAKHLIIPSPADLPEKWTIENLKVKKL